MTRLTFILGRACFVAHTLHGLFYPRLGWVPYHHTSWRDKCKFGEGLGSWHFGKGVRASVARQRVDSGRQWQGHVRIVNLVNAELWCIGSIITATFSESEGPGCDALCVVRRGFLVAALFGTPCTSANGLSHQAQVLLIVWPQFLVTLKKLYWVPPLSLFCCWFVSLLVLMCYSSILSLTDRH